MKVLKDSASDVGFAVSVFQARVTGWIDKSLGVGRFKLGVSGELAPPRFEQGADVFEGTRCVHCVLGTHLILSFVLARD